MSSHSLSKSYIRALLVLFYVRLYFPLIFLSYIFITKRIFLSMFRVISVCTYRHVFYGLTSSVIGFCSPVDDSE